MPDHEPGASRGPRDWVRATEALLTLWTVRVGLRLGAFPQLVRYSRTVASLVGNTRYRGVEQPVGLAVSRAARRMSDPTCLEQALTLRLMLAHRGIASSLRIGVTYEHDTLGAHAWVERDGSVLPPTHAQSHCATFPALD